MQFLSVLFTIFVSINVFSCSKNEDLESSTSSNKEIIVDRGTPVEIGINLIGKDKKNLLSCPYSKPLGGDEIAKTHKCDPKCQCKCECKCECHTKTDKNCVCKCHINCKCECHADCKTCKKHKGHHHHKKHHEKEIYALKLYKKSLLSPDSHFEMYAYGLFDDKHLDDIKFTGYNLEEYRVESTVIKRGTGFGLFSPDGINYKAPFYARLNNEFFYEKNTSFLPADYQTLMATGTPDEAKLYNHAELDRFYGFVKSFTPSTQESAVNEIILDMYRVSFDLVFQVEGEPIMDNQRVVIRLFTGEMRSGELEEYVFYITNFNFDRKDHKIIAHGRNDGLEQFKFYRKIFNKPDFTETFDAIASLETVNNKGEIIDFIILGETNKLEVKRGHKTTYTLENSKRNTDVKIGFKWTNSEWMDDEPKPFPSCNSLNPESIQAH